MDDGRRIFERARSVKPQREFNILVAGGEPTIAQTSSMPSAMRERWFKRICVVTDGIRMGQEHNFAGMRAAGID